MSGNTSPSLPASARPGAPRLGGRSQGRGTAGLGESPLRIPPMWAVPQPGALPGKARRSAADALRRGLANPLSYRHFHSSARIRTRGAARGTMSYQFHLEVTSILSAARRATRSLGEATPALPGRPRRRTPAAASKRALPRRGAGPGSANGCGFARSGAGGHAAGPGRRRRSREMRALEPSPGPNKGRVGYR